MQIVDNFKGERIKKQKLFNFPNWWNKKKKKSRKNRTNNLTIEFVSLFRPKKVFFFLDANNWLATTYPINTSLLEFTFISTHSQNFFSFFVVGEIISRTHIQLFNVMNVQYSFDIFATKKKMKTKSRKTSSLHSSVFTIESWFFYH